MLLHKKSVQFRTQQSFGKLMCQKINRWFLGEPQYIPGKKINQFLRDN